MQGDSLPEVSAAQAREMVRGNAVLLDVREEHEWIAGHAAEAVHMPMSGLAERVSELPTDQTIICVCHVGSRSAAVAEALNRAGWEAVNLIGGMAAWVAAGFSVVDTDGRPGYVI